MDHHNTFDRGTRDKNIMILVFWVLCANVQASCVVLLQDIVQRGGENRSLSSMQDMICIERLGIINPESLFNFLH
jgi:hypothetical protein